MPLRCAPIHALLRDGAASSKLLSLYRKPGLEEEDAHTGPGRRRAACLAFCVRVFFFEPSALVCGTG
eukprot:scaffold23477_cov60-Phaeocystis_antarctica.AAC.3